MKKLLTNEELLKTADEARINSYAPFSGFRVGAALITCDGKVYSGVNIENSSFGAGICAERVAFAKAISEGEREFRAIAVSAGDVESIPCGICRQFIYEFAPDIEIITRAEGLVKVYTLRELLPQAFVLKGNCNG